MGRGRQRGYSFFVDWGFWIGVAGTVLGAVGVVYGIWARSHPGSGRLAFRVTESALIPQSSHVERLRVLLEDREITDPWLAVVDIINVGGIDLSPAAFEGGYLRLITSGSTNYGRGIIESVLTPVDGTLRVSERPDGVFVDPDMVESVFELAPRQLKAGEGLSLTVLASHRPRIRVQGRLAGFEIGPPAAQVRAGILRSAAAGAVVASTRLLR